MLAVLAAGAALVLVPPRAQAQKVSFEGATFVNKGLVGVARVPSNAVDQLGDTLGGFGSGMALVPGTWRKNADGSFGGSLVMVPDRGWNGRGTTDYAGRLQNFDVTLRPFYGAAAETQDQLAMTYRGTTRLRDANGNSTTGLDAATVRPAGGGFPALPIGPNGRLSVDDEAVAFAGDGTIWVSDEYGPYIYHYSPGGALIGAIRPPDAFIPKRMSAGGSADDFSSNSPPEGTSYKKGNPVSGRQNNQGFEGMSISPDKTRLFVLLQSALIQDTNPKAIRDSRRDTRLLAYDITGPAPSLVGEYVVQLPQYGESLSAAESELLALNDHQLLVLARDSNAGFSAKDPLSRYRSVDLIDVADVAHPASNIANGPYDSPDRSVAPNGVLDPSIVPVAYRKFLDINDNAELNRLGLHNGAPNDRNDLYEKWESMTLAPALDAANPDDFFLFVDSDNDFATQDGHMAGKPYRDKSGADVDTLVLVYRVTLPGYGGPRK